LRSELYDHPDLYDALLPAGTHLPFYLDLAREKGGAVLELACGTGQLIVPIASSGLATAGLDRSGPMLSAARARASASGVPIEFVQSDMRSFDLGRRFELIFIARNSLLHLLSTDDFLSTFAAVRRHLAPGGTFAFDVFNPDVRILAQPVGTRARVRELTHESFGFLFLEASHDYDAATQVDRGTWYVSRPEQPDAWVMSVQVRSIFPQELPLLIAAGGLRLLHRFGDLSREPFQSASPRQVCLCRAEA
jgi:SAM-dependent methyltransferase